MNKVSAVIITKNAEEVIADCIDSVSFCDEVLIVDSDSTDRTVEIAKYKGARVVETKEISFAEKRNVGLHKTKYEWVLYIDADERVTRELEENIRKVLSIEKRVSSIKDTGIVAYRLKRKNYYLGKHEWPVVEELERLFKKSSLKRWYGDLHETAEIDGNIGDLDGVILHFTHRDLTSMLEKTIMWSDVEARLRFDNHHPKMTWWRFPRVMLSAFYDSYIKQKGYAVGTAGLIESIFQVFSMFITYAKLWELQQKKKHK